MDLADEAQGPTMVAQVEVGDIGDIDGAGIPTDLGGNLDDEAVPNWFIESGSDDDNDKLLQSVDKTVDGRWEFRQSIKGFLKSKSSSEKISTSKAELEDQIATYDMVYSLRRNDAIGALSQATEARRHYEQERQTGAKKVGKIAQSFVKSFADFLHVYSGIIELLRGAGQVYGEVAYETLSILFVVVVNKSGNDSKITGLLLELRKSFPQLDDWTNIYPTLSMKTLVTEVYKQIIEFARDASIYFTRFSTRFWRAIGRPPSIGIDKTAAMVHRKLAEVSSEAMIHLHRRSQRIHLNVEKSYAKIENLERLNSVLVDSYKRLHTQYEDFRAQVELEQENQDKQRLELFKETLNVTFPSNSTTLSACSSTLTKAFNFGSSRTPAYQKMTPDYLNSLSAYKPWASISQGSNTDLQDSSFLLLGGKTAPEARTSRGFTHSWLSPAATHLVESVRNAGGRVAFYSCHPGIRADSEEGSHFGRDVVASMAFQVLQFRPHILRHKMAQFSQLVRGTQWQGSGKGSEEGMRKPEPESASVEVWFVLLKEILSELVLEGPVYIVLDRVDLVEGCSLRYFLEGLVRVVVDERCFVKVLVIMSTARKMWDAEGWEEDGRVVVLQDLDQKKTRPSETPTLTFSQSYPG